MRKPLLTFSLTTLFLCFISLTFAQVGIGTLNPDASARLQVDANSSTNAKGFLPPRVALQGTDDAQLTSPNAPTIASPALGLLVYNTATAGSGANAVTPGFYYYNGAAWVRLVVPTDKVANVTGTVAVVNGGTGVNTSTGSGNVVLSISPTLTTPNLGAATATSIVSPSIIGGSSISQTLTYKTTTGVGTSGADHIFQVGNNGGTEAMRITNGGKIGIGTPSPSTALHIENSNSIGSGDPGNNSVPGIYVYNSNNSSSTAHSIVSIRTNASTGGKPYISFDANGHAGYSIGLNNPTDQLIINTDWNFNTGTASKNAIIINETGQSRVIIPSSSGNYASDWVGGWGGGLSTYDISCASVYASNYVTRSDQRLKNSIKSLDESVFSKYFKLRPVTYYWNERISSDTKLQYGLIAQEVERIFPEIVNTATDSMHTKSVNYQALHALSIKVIQSQQTELDLLQKKYAELEIRLQKLESKLK